MPDFDNIIDDVFPEGQDPVSLAEGFKAAEDDPRLWLPPPTDPMKVAARFIEDQYLDRGHHRLLRHSRNTFYVYSGTHWPEAEDRTLRSRLYDYLQDAMYVKMVYGKPEGKPWEPNRRKVEDVLDALKAQGHLPADVNPPTWIGGDHDDLDPRDLISLENGILHIPTRTLIDHSPEFWSHNTLPYPYDPKAEIPNRWEKFLAELWPDDSESISTLQEIFGYLLTVDTTQQKMMLLVGPKRSGKGTIARVLTGLLGAHNVAAPTLAGLATNFGVSPLIDRPLAITSDARLGTRADTAIVVERLLSISGEDSITIDRKYRDPWTGRLPTRFLILSNELPRLSDSSGALASRFVILTLTLSFYGREDSTLTDTFLEGATGILNWALDGLDRLRDRGYFVQPASSAEALTQLEDLASPVSAFVRDRCVVGPGYRVPVDDLYKAWRLWATEQGHTRISTAATFGRDLRAVVPNVHRGRPRVDGDRVPHYDGIGLQPLHSSGPEDNPGQGPEW